MSRVTPMSSVDNKAERTAIMDALLKRLTDPNTLKEVPLTADEVQLVIDCAIKLYKKKPQTMLYLEAPMYVCGDTHGQYRDVVRIFQQNGWPNSSRFLFLGDYVDRGTRSIETMSLLFSLKIGYPKGIFLLRGNHEVTEINDRYGFKAELVKRFGKEKGMKLFRDFNEAFMWMPVAAVVSRGQRSADGPSRMFCMHGGIPMKQMAPEFDELKALKLPIKSPRDHEIIADLLWSDPSDDATEFVKNTRGLGHQFGPVQVTEFCERHKLDLICRAHQVFREGFKWMGDNCVTVFSAPNYGGQFENSAAIVGLSEKDDMLEISLVQPYHVTK